jgi:hypothetical protein
MTVADLIARCLSAIRSQFYEDQAPRNFHRDERALTKAIARYGYVCNERGWQFDELHVTRAIVDLLPKIKPPDRQYLPTYLENCIDRHVRQRAEELSAKAKATPNRLAIVLKAASAMATATEAAAVVTPRAPSATEQLDQIYRDLARRKRTAVKQAKAIKAQPQAVEMTLF